MNENRPPEDGPPSNQAPNILSGDADAEQLELPIPPDDRSLGEWIEWMPKDTQYRLHRMAA
jgi:hypothetical protein